VPVNDGIFALVRENEGGTRKISPGNLDEIALT